MEEGNGILIVLVPFIIQMFKSDSEMHTSCFNKWLLIVFYPIT